MCLGGQFGTGHCPARQVLAFDVAVRTGAVIDELLRWISATGAGSRRTRRVDPALAQCRANVSDVDPALCQSQVFLCRGVRISGRSFLWDTYQDCLSDSDDATWSTVFLQNLMLYIKFYGKLYVVSLQNSTR